MRRRTLSYLLSLGAAVMIICSIAVMLSRFYQPGYAAQVHSAASSATVWQTYMFRNNHEGNNPYEAQLNASNVSSLSVNWTFTAHKELVAEPIIVNGVIYEGSWDGYMYALDATNGAVLWKTNVGTYSSDKCGPRGGPSGVAAYYKGMVFVGSGPYFFGLNASTGDVVWQRRLGTSDTDSDHIWDSATIGDGRIFVGVASLCDHPLTQGMLYALNPATGAIHAQADIVPDGKIGGGIWSAPSIDEATGTVIVSTGSIDIGRPSPMEAAVVTLDWNTLAVKQYWQVPAAQRIHDADFGSAPTLFPGPNGKTYFGCMNKNSIYYVFDEANVSAGPVWEQQLGPGGYKGGIDGSIASGAYVNGVLYIPSALATVNNTSYPGSIGAFNAITGQQLWRVGTSGTIYASTITANGLLFDAEGNTLEIRDQSTGNILYSHSVNSPIEASPTIANGVVYFAAFNDSLYALTTQQ